MNRGRIVGCFLTLFALVGSVAACVPPQTDVPGAVTVSMDATYSSGFFSLPWPSSIRKKPNGTLDLLGFPGSDLNLAMFAAATAASDLLSDYGTQTAIYLRLTGPVDETSLPDPATTGTAESPVQLIDLDHPDVRVPVLVRVEPVDHFRSTNLLSLLPYPGHTMKPATRYAAVITRGVRDTAGQRLAPAPLLSQLDEQWWLGRAHSEHDWNELRAQRDDVRAALAAGGAWAGEDLAGFTVFRTEDSTREMRSMASAIDHIDVASPALEPGLPCAPGDASVTRSGSLELPLFQRGDYPFSSSGGGVDIDDEGRAVVQRTRSVPLALRIPCGEAPPGGWPIETFIDGTGGGANVFKAIGFVDEAIAASIPPLYGVGTGVPDPTSEGNFYNALNPEAARTNPLQQAADNVALLKVLERLQLDGAPFGSATPIHADATREMISGQSQGAQTLPLVAAMNPRVGTVIAGAGVAGFYNQIGYRTSGREQLGQFAPIDELDIRNPFDQLIAMVVDTAEPANYPTTGNYLNFAGRDDGCVPLEASRHLDGAQHLAIVNAQWPSIFGAPSLDPPQLIGPVTGNASGATRVSVESPGGHAIAYANGELASSFTAQAFAGLAPTVPAGPYFADSRNCEPRYGLIASQS